MRPTLWADRLLGLLVRFVGLVILLAAMMGATASFLYNGREEAKQAERLALQINVRLRDQLAVLEGVRALYQSDMETSGPGIRAYLAALQPKARAPGMQGVGIAIAMRQGTPAAAEARLLENYGKPIRVWPTTSEPIGFPIVLIEPDEPRNHAALGYDMYSNPVRREAMRRAWQTGQPAASGIVQLVQERLPGRKQPGFLIYIPVYANHAPNSGIALNGAHPKDEVVATARGARAIEAFVYAPFRVEDLMTATIGNQLSNVDGIEILAGEGPSAQRVFNRGTVRWDAHEQTLRVADRRWTVRISYGRFFERLGRPLAILLFGVALALLAAQLHRVQQRRLQAFQALAEEKARHAEDRELMIGEMAHRMKNAFARIGALARITLREASDLDDFETKFDGRLRALSDTKQMLVTGAVDTVELGAIIRRELETAGWPAAQREAITGPDVHLDDEAAQALTLAVHELVTNSVKYGALSGRGALAVDWHRDGGNVELSWSESDLPETPEFGTESFGTHFIRSLIERQLKGEWNRAAADHRLDIRIRWPDRTPDAAARD
ncbi:MAG: CHASE domain-containing protein [Sphingopyxis sp.]|uniref:CHASE domain-containing protein n=1 Tax=Sphingopyxis sp. TaxID=1908224 RepID=UPI002ABA5DDE|nr:CHASE domain-containing protein [Sphingopyxis sp.]MDZ3832341.1 CHASE domain-containing protein [Sphingopyxis sp.]